MNKNIISIRNKRKNNTTKSKVINVDATNNIKLQTYKKVILNKAIKEINKIEKGIKNLN